MPYKKFEDQSVSTKTLIAATNLTFDIVKIFNIIKTVDYVLPESSGKSPIVDLEDGLIISLDLNGKIKGCDTRKKSRKEKKSCGSYFRNSMTVVMAANKKLINFKVCNSGILQVTGCKYDSQCELAIKIIWNIVKDNPELYTIQGDNVIATIVPAMRNIDFHLGFSVNREELDKYVNIATEYRSYLDPVDGYSGVNIKLPLVEKFDQIMIKQIRIEDDKWSAPYLITYQAYLDSLTEKERKKKLKDRHHTFLVFQSGKVIMSSLCREVAEKPYYEFINIIKDCKELILDN